MIQYKVSDLKKKKKLIWKSYIYSEIYNVFNFIRKYIDVIQIWIFGVQCKTKDIIINPKI